MSTRSEQGEGSLSGREELKEDDTISMTSKMSRMSFEPARHSVGRNMSFHKKVIGYKIRTVSELIYEDELVKNMAMEICYEVINTNPNSSYIPLNVCLEGYNKYELCAYIIVVVLYAWRKIIISRVYVEKS